MLWRIPLKFIGIKKPAAELSRQLVKIITTQKLDFCVIKIFYNIV